jgi:post-segregation antitoxin (ccd killing protein)
VANRERFSISIDPEVRAALKEHARALGVDVSSYVTAAVQRQLAEDDLIRQRFADIDAEIAASEVVPPGEEPWPDFDEAELAEARAGMARALGDEGAQAA